VYTALILVCGLAGLAIGSFLNVVIYRVPLGLSVVSPPSACPGCEAPIRPIDNVPVLSWLLLRGRCRSCGMRISARYPLVELSTALLFVATAARFGAKWCLPAYLVLGAGLLALALIDAERMLLPKRIVYPASIGVAALLLLASVATPWWRGLWVGALCAAAWLALFLVLHLVSPRSLGFGDVRLAPLLGFSLGWLGVWYCLYGFIAANLLGALVGGALILSKRRSHSEPIPYGIYLAIGAELAILSGPLVLRPLQGH
jgi:leader peptidase (prepilin peptidase)/N-methyltransferase